MILSDKLSIWKANEYNFNIFEDSKINLDRVTLKIDKVVEMSEQDQQKLFETFNKFKFVILECDPSPNPQENLLALGKFFGSVKRHQRSDRNGIVPVENLGKLAPEDQISATNRLHPIHTDGSFDMDPPKVVAMQCEIPSKHGGLSQIVYGQDVYEYLLENYVQELYKLFANPLTITRGERTATRPIFVEKEGRISIAFRSDSVISVEMNFQIEKGFRVIKNYVNEPKNQLIFKLKANQILLIENNSVLHGRTSFPDNEVRKINRLWFDGVSEYAQYLKFGFLPKTKI